MLVVLQCYRYKQLVITALITESQAKHVLAESTFLLF
jgi:hypothetical protein